MSRIKDLFFKEAVIENRSVNSTDLNKFLEYINKIGDEGSQFDAKDVGKIIDNKGRFSLDRVRNELAKHVSAFANTSGGLLAIGIKEERYGDPKFSLNNFDLGQINLQHLQRALATCVEPKTEFSIELVEMDHESEKPLGIMLIFIEQSLTPPHQVVNNRSYYFRHGESSNPAPHSLVSALFRYRKSPDLSIDVIKVRSPSQLRVLIKNKGNAPALHTHILINIFPALIKGNQVLLNKKIIEKSTDGLWNIKEFIGSHRQNFMKFRFRAKPGQIVLPGVNEILFALPFSSFEGAKMHVELYCDGFEGSQEFSLY